MAMSNADRDELLAGLALEAVEGGGERATAEGATTSGESAEVLSEMQEVVALLGEADAVAPPSDLFDTILSAVSDLPPSTVVDPAPPVVVYRHMVEAMSERLDRLTPDVCTRRAEPYDWTIQGLIGHLTSIEQYTAAKLGIADFDYPEEREMDHLGLGEHVIQRELEHAPAETFAAWRAAADVVLAHGGSLDRADLEIEVPFHGFPTRLSILYVLRAFEIWTHIEDVSRAGGLGPMIPEPADLRAMSTMSVRLARWVLGMTSAEHGDGMLRVVLTGDGGGVFPVRFGSGEGPVTTVVADVADYCRMAAQRLEPGQLEADIDGRREVAQAFFAAAATIAV